MNKKLSLPLAIVALALVGACNRSADQTPQTGPKAAAPTVPPSVNQSPTSALKPEAPAGGGTTSSTQQESPSKGLSKQEESTAMPRPGQGGADHSTPAREPGAKSKG